MKKRIGILTSGGDCAGLNAIIRAVVMHAVGNFGWQVFGIKNGTSGLLGEPETQELTVNSIGTYMLRLGGTVLGTTNKGNPFSYPQAGGAVVDRSPEIIENYNKLGLDALIGIGGDGSLQILHEIAKRGKINLVGVPKTIDNDLGLTDQSIGFRTAVEVAMEALDRLQPTAASHSRVMVLEVMGRDAGHIALEAGIAGGADVILIPEIAYKMENVASKIKALNSRGRNFALIIVAESVRTENNEPVTVQHDSLNERYGGIGHYVGKRLMELTDAEVRVMTLGHVQRGGQPVSQDRVLASAFGVHAVDLIKNGTFGRMVAWQNRQVVDVPIEEAFASYQCVDVKGALVKTAKGVGISFGD